MADAHAAPLLAHPPGQAQPRLYAGSNYNWSTGWLFWLVPSPLQYWRVQPCHRGGSNSRHGHFSL